MAGDIGSRGLIETPTERVIREQAEENRRSRNYRELQLFFNGILMLATVVTAGVVLYQNHVLSETLKEITDQTKAMQDALAETAKQTTELVSQTNAAQDAAKSARDGVGVSARGITSTLAQGQKAMDASIQANRLDQRAWAGVVSIVRVTPQAEGKTRRTTDPLTVGDQIIFRVRIQNSGTTPANGVAIHREISILPPTDRTIDPRHDAERGELAISPNVTFQSDVATIPLTQPLVTAAAAHAPVYFFGTIHYRDVWDVGHETTFCAIWVFPSTPLEFCGIMNHMR